MYIGAIILVGVVAAVSDCGSAERQRRREEIAHWKTVEKVKGVAQDIGNVGFVASMASGGTNTVATSVGVGGNVAAATLSIYERTMKPDDI